ncbi:MAG: AMP-binding protein [Candidatus Binatia bacterium]|nr:AMP-binding protein [Candidatus Binatia bacterium]
MASRDEILRLAIERARQSPFYAQHLEGHTLESRKDLASLPFTKKGDLTAASPFGMLAVPPSKAWHYHETSGTTGEPTSTWSGLDELKLMATRVHSMVPELDTETILLNRFPLFAPVSFVFEETLRQAGACHIAAGNMSWDVPFTRALEFIQRLKVTAISSLPLEPILLRELARDQGLDLRKGLGSVEVIFCGGAVLPPALRRVIEHDWEARIVEIYGSNETMLMGVGCTEGRLHLCEELLEFEILHPDTHEPVGPGEAGIVTITSLVQEVMPLVRYVTEDLVRRETEPCPCGRADETIEVLGRLEEAVEIAGGRAMHYEILDAAYEFADELGTRIFFILIRPHELRLLVELDDPSGAHPVEAERKLAERIGLPITVERLGPNEVLDRSAMFRTPSIYKPSVISDWRRPGRKPITIMEALLEWPTFDGRTLFHLGKRQIRNALRRRRLTREDAQRS